MTAYAPTDFRATSVPGGCGQQHVRPDDLPDDEKWGVTCPTCEPLLLAMTGYGWANHPDQVELTPDERAEYERAAAMAQRNQALTWSDPTALVQAIQSASSPTGAPAPGASLLALLAQASPDERAALKAMLADEPAAKKAPVKKAAKKAAPAAPAVPDEDPAPDAPDAPPVDGE